MELKYGITETYKYKLDNNCLDWLTIKTNRAKHQTQFLFNLVDGDFEKLKKLEIQIKNCFVHYCPASVEEVKKIMNMKTKSEYFSF